MVNKSSEIKKNHLLMILLATEMRVLSSLLAVYNQWIGLAIFLFLCGLIESQWLQVPSGNSQ